MEPKSKFKFREEDCDSRIKTDLEVGNFLREKRGIEEEWYRQGELNPCSKNENLVS